jgi:hypothetical protein
MSDDVVKRLQYLGRCAKYYDQEHMTSADYEMIPIVTKEAADRIEELEAKLASLVPALSYEGLRTDEAEAKLTIALVGLVQSRDELDQYSQNEYPSDHPVHERCRQRDYDANPARIAIANIKGEQT